MPHVLTNIEGAKAIKEPEKTSAALLQALLNEQSAKAVSGDSDGYERTWARIAPRMRATDASWHEFEESIKRAIHKRSIIEPPKDDDSDNDNDDHEPDVIEVDD